MQASQLYVEVCLQQLGSPASTGAAPAFGVGVAFGDAASVCLDHMPGWDAGTIGLHSDDGRLFDQNGAADAAVVRAPAFHAVGKVAGVGLFPVTSASGGGFELVFTLDGSKVYSRVLAAPADLIAKMSLAVGMVGHGVTVSSNRLCGGNSPCVPYARLR